MKRFLAMILMLLLPMTALADGCVINLLEQPDAVWHFEEGAELLEVVFPRVHGSDCCILRMGDQTMMVDASTEDQRPLVAESLKAMGITRVDTAFGSHPHDDHLTGFEYVPETAEIGRLLVALPLDYNYVMRRTVRVMGELGIPVETVADGDELTLGQAELTVIQRMRTDFTTNDRSAMLLVRYGERTLFLAGDIENRGQAALIDNPPACGLKTDVLKYPHHGHTPVRDGLFELWNPELVVVTAHTFPAKDGFDYLKRKDTPAVSTYYAPLRLRTDGRIWVLDNLPMPDGEV